MELHECCRIPNVDAKVYIVLHILCTMGTTKKGNLIRVNKTRKVQKNKREKMNETYLGKRYL